jgi:hypothetical protein
MEAGGLLTTGARSDACAAVTSALDLITEAERTAGDATYSHLDHKPENSLLSDDGLVVVDWDECGHCPPRLEAAESALRWAGGAAPDVARFRAFVERYEIGGGRLSPIEPLDFSKWLAALVGWASFSARRALGDHDDDEGELDHASAAAMAVDALCGLESSLRSLETWASWGR